MSTLNSLIGYAFVGRCPACRGMFYAAAPSSIGDEAREIDIMRVQGFILEWVPNDQVRAEWGGRCEHLKLVAEEESRAQWLLDGAELGNRDEIIEHWRKFWTDLIEKGVDGGT